MTRLAGLVTNSLVRALSWLYTLGLGWGDTAANRATDPLYDPTRTQEDLAERAVVLEATRALNDEWCRIIVADLCGEPT